MLIQLSKRQFKKLNDFDKIDYLISKYDIIENANVHYEWKKWELVAVIACDEAFGIKVTVACDNRDGCCWVHQFKRICDAYQWLDGKEITEFNHGEVIA